jgi:pimeloyl-ACP methyl ester carboxylesterase
MLSSHNLTQPVEVYFGSEDWADRVGCNNLAKIQSNFSVNILEKCGHMLPLHLPELKSIIEKRYEK